MGCRETHKKMAIKNNRKNLYYILFTFQWSKKKGFKKLIYMI